VRGEVLGVRCEEIAQGSGQECVRREVLVKVKVKVKVKAKVRTSNQ
jgi:hypothetical protein